MADKTTLNANLLVRTEDQETGRNSNSNSNKIDLSTDNKKKRGNPVVLDVEAAYPTKKLMTQDHRRASLTTAYPNDIGAAAAAAAAAITMNTNPRRSLSYEELKQQLKIALEQLSLKDVYIHKLEGEVIELRRQDQINQILLGQQMKFRAEQERLRVAQDESWKNLLDKPCMAPKKK